MIVTCSAYQNGVKIADLAPEDISEYVCQPGTFVWVAIKDPEPAELDAMAEEFDLHPLAVEDANKGHQRPKLEEYGDSLFAVMHVPQRRDGDMEVAEVSLFVGPNYVLSVRRGVEPGFARVRQRAESEPDLLRHGSGFVMYALMDDVVDRYFPLVGELETELEQVEKRIFSGDSARANIEALYNLKFQTMVLRHAVEPLLDSVQRLYGGRVPRVAQGTQEYFRDVHDHLIRVSQQLEGLRDMVTTATAVNLSMISLAEGEVTKRLAAYAALVAVPTLIAGIYGMNFEHMPELKWLFGYPMALTLMFGIDVYLWRRLKKAGWL